MAAKFCADYSIVAPNAALHSGEVRIFGSTGNVVRVIASATRIESCDAVIDTHERAGDFKERPFNSQHYGRFVISICPPPKSDFATDIESVNLPLTQPLLG